MALQLSSDDVSTGEIFNGTWDFVQTISGDFNIIYQYIGVGDIPWIWGGVNDLKINFPFGEINYSIVVSLDTSLNTSTNYTAIEAQWELDINTELAQLSIDSGGDVDVTCSITYNSVSEMLEFVFADVPETVQFLFADPLCTCAGVFGKSSTISHASTIELPVTYMNPSPKYLYLKISQSGTIVNISKDFYPTCILSTSDNQVINQDVSFFNNTNQLTIKIYRTNIIIDPVPMHNKWDIILQ